MTTVGGLASRRKLRDGSQDRDEATSQKRQRKERQRADREQDLVERDNLGAQVP